MDYRVQMVNLRVYFQPVEFCNFIEIFHIFLGLMEYVLILIFKKKIYLHISLHTYGELIPLAFIDGFSLVCSNNGSNTTKTMSVNITVIGIYDGLHHPP